MKAAAADSSTWAYTHKRTHYIVITSNKSSNLIYCYQIPTTNNSCRKWNADIMTHRHSTQSWDTHSLQPPTIQANSVNTSEYLMTYAGSASCKRWQTRRKRIVTTLNKQTHEQVKRNKRNCVTTCNINQDGTSRYKSSSVCNKQVHVVLTVNKTGNVRINVTLKRVLATIVAVEKRSVLHNMNMYVALITQHAMHMRHIVICGLPSSTTFFHVISYMARFKKKNYWTRNGFWFSLWLLSETFLILRWNEWDTIKNV